MTKPSAMSPGGYESKSGPPAARSVSAIAFLIAVAVQPALAATIKDLGTLGGFYTYAYAINASGQVVGTSTPNRR
jgi:uncharacterized membrane protein